MDANGLSKSGLPSSCFGRGVFGHTATNADDLMTNVATTIAATPDRMGGSAIAATIQTAMDTGAASTAAPITPTGSRDNSFHGNDEENDDCGYHLKGVCDNVALAKSRVRDIEDQIANCTQGIANTKSPQQTESSLALLRNHLFTENICLIDALVIMGWEHYRWLLAKSSSFEKAEATVRHIYEEALDVSIKLFCSSPPASSNSVINNERLMILLLVLDFDEYCESLLEYQLTREYMAADGTGNNQTMEEMLNPSKRGENYLQQMHELWKSGQFDRFDPTASEEEDSLAKIHAAGLCLVLFRKLESQVHRQETDLATMEKQFRFLFDDYLPKQLTHPSMNNIVASKYARVLFQDGTPTVYWSLLVDSYRKEWGENFDRDIIHSGSGGDGDDDSTDMDTDDDEDDGL